MTHVGFDFLYLLRISGYELLSLFVLLILGSLYFKWYFSWELSHRRGLKYYGEPLAARRAFKRKIKIHAFFLSPIIFIEAKLQRIKNAHPIPSIQFNQVYGPSFSCSQEAFQKAAAYRPSAHDIFVVTQMRCGTTWMQQMIFQILTKGNGSFSDNGPVHLCAISPWIEALDGVSIEAAPLIGSSAKKILKTHMPTKLCPYSAAAHYIYVIRHPLSCFASIIDYFQLTAGPFAPPVSQVVKWFCSDRMWWLSWPEHVAGWWAWSQRRNNIFFVQFEEMKKNPTHILRHLSRFLGEGLSQNDIEKIRSKIGFQYMKDNEAYFEMVPPNLFSVHGTYFKSGKIDRFKNVADENRQKILSFCRQRLADLSFPVERFYPDIVSEVVSDKSVG